MGLSGSRPQLPFLCDSGSISLEKSAHKEIKPFERMDFLASYRVGKWMSVPIINSELQTPRFEETPPQVVCTPRTPRAIFRKVCPMPLFQSKSTYSTVESISLIYPLYFAQADPMETNKHFREDHISGSVDDQGCACASLPLYDNRGTSESGGSTSELTKSIVLKAIQDLKCRTVN
jgi:hypothetical protein